MVAYVLVALAFLHAVDCVRERSSRSRAGAVALAAVLLLQAVLGVAALLGHVPMLLALSHQLVAMLALSLATVHARIVVAAGSTEKARVRRDQGFAGRPLSAAE
jgi:cytochrome c oxidase assembly protein subunit 15